MIIQKMQNNNKGYGFNEVFIHSKQSKCLFTGKNVAKRGEKIKKEDKKAVMEDITTFQRAGECYIIQACVKQMNNYSEQCARRKENELEKS